MFDGYKARTYLLVHACVEDIRKKLVSTPHNLFPWMFCTKVEMVEESLDGSGNLVRASYEPIPVPVEEYKWDS